MCAVRVWVTMIILKMAKCVKRKFQIYSIPVLTSPEDV